MRNPLRRPGTCAALAALLALGAAAPASAGTTASGPWPLPHPLPRPLPGFPLPSPSTSPFPWLRPGKSLPLPAFGDLLVDNAHHVLYISGGRTANSVLVVGFDGRVRKTIDKQYGASAMSLSADGRTLYVALAAGDAVSAIDTTSLTETARYTTPTSHICPTTLARTGSRLWVGYGCGDAWDGGIAELDTSAPTPRIVLAKQDQTKDAHYSAAPRVAAATPDTGATLAVSQPALSPVTIATYHVDGDQLRLQASAPRGGSNLNDLTIAPDGTTVYSAAGSQHEIDAFTTSDLSSTGAYTTGPAPTALALTPDGTQLATTTSQPGAAITLYAIGKSRPTTTERIPRDQIPAAHGLAVTPDARTVFLITHRPQDSRPHLAILHGGSRVRRARTAR